MAVNHGLKIDCSNGSCDFREVKLWLLPYFLEKLDSSTSGQDIEQLSRHPVTCCRTTLCGLYDFPLLYPWSNSEVSLGGWHPIYVPNTETTTPSTQSLMCGMTSAHQHSHGLLFLSLKALPSANLHGDRRREERGQWGTACEFPLVV